MLSFACRFSPHKPDALFHHVFDAEYLLLTRPKKPVRISSMGRGKEQFIALTGGFRIGESQVQAMQRAKQIEALTKKLKSGKLSSQQVENTWSAYANSKPCRHPTNSERMRKSLTMNLRKLINNPRPSFSAFSFGPYPSEP